MEMEMEKSCNIISINACVSQNLLLLLFIIPQWHQPAPINIFYADDIIRTSVLCVPEWSY